MADTSRPSRGASHFTATQATLSTEAEAIADVRDSRVRLLVKNNDESIAVYLGDALGVTANTGFALAGGESVALNTTAEVFAIAASGTPVISVLEEYEND